MESFLVWLIWIIAAIACLGSIGAQALKPNIALIANALRDDSDAVRSEALLALPYEGAPFPASGRRQKFVARGHGDILDSEAGSGA